LTRVHFAGMFPVDISWLADHSAVDRCSCDIDAQSRGYNF
jgi:hypothetical protein